MGAGSIIAAIVAVAAILIAANVVITGGLYMADTLTSSMKEVQDTKNEQLKTEIEIGNITADGSTIDVTLANTGHEKIREFSQMDVILHYYTPAGGGTLKIVWISYTEETTPGDNEWTITGISPDNINPGIFDPDEEMTILIKVSGSPVKVGSENNWLQITTPNGVSTSKYFSG